MSIKNNNIFENMDIGAFGEEFAKVVKNAVEKYWEQETQVAFHAINDFKEFRRELLIKNIDFFSSQIVIENHLPIIIRLSKDFIEDYLQATLEGVETHFKLTTITPLEVKILNNFCDFLYKKINEILVPIKDLKISDKSEKNYNILLMLMLENKKSSHVMFTIPQDRIDFSKIKKMTTFKDEDFLTSSTNVRIKAGSSKISLEDLKNLSTDDIVLLENSDVSKLLLISGELEKSFNVKVDSSLVLNLDEDDDEEDLNEQIKNEVIMDKNLWDDIQIEINAEFEKIKMTIGELKQITQGQIVDLGSVFNNEISLFVENKKVAKGELIIINDKYAVRLNEVFSSNAQGKIKEESKLEKPASPEAKQAPPKPQTPPPVKQPLPPKQLPPKPQTPPPPVKAQEEDFDYSDFEK